MDQRSLNDVDVEQDLLWHLLFVMAFSTPFSVDEIVLCKQLEFLSWNSDFCMWLRERYISVSGQALLVILCDMSITPSVLCYAWSTDWWRSDFAHLLLIVHSYMNPKEAER